MQTLFKSVNIWQSYRHVQTAIVVYQHVHCESKKTGPFSFEHNFCNILSDVNNFSLLQTVFAKVILKWQGPVFLIAVYM